MKISVPMNIFKVISPDVKRSYLCHGITEATEDKNIILRNN